MHLPLSQTQAAPPHARQPNPVHLRRALRAWPLALLLAGGCAEELGPLRYPTTTVEGRVMLAGRPVRAGFVEFHPAESTVGNFDSAEIAPDGTYRADRVPVGALMVRIVQTKPRLPAAYSDYASPLRFRAETGRVNRYDVNVALP